MDPLTMLTWALVGLGVSCAVLLGVWLFYELANFIYEDSQERRRR